MQALVNDTTSTGLESSRLLKLCLVSLKFLQVTTGQLNPDFRLRNDLVWFVSDGHIFSPFYNFYKNNEHKNKKTPRCLQMDERAICHRVFLSLHSIWERVCLR